MKLTLASALRLRLRGAQLIRRAVRKSLSTIYAPGGCYTEPFRLLGLGRLFYGCTFPSNMKNVMRNISAHLMLGFFCHYM